ncbi:MAG: hypothetical protein ACRESC_02385, partial [Gammaproteobacteria bacterium]
MKRALALFLVVPVALAGCVKGSDSTSSSPNPNAGFQARFAPLSGIMPFPNDLYFNGSTTGTLNIPVLDPTQAANAPTLAMNHLDGFGTQSVINAYFSDSIKASSLSATDVMVFQVTTDPSTKAITSFVKPLVQDTDYSVGVSSGADADGVASGTVLNIMPLKPLASGSSYLVILTTGIKDTDGDAVTPSSDYAAILAADTPALTATGPDPTKIDASALPETGLLPVAQFTLAQLAVAAAASVDITKVALTFSFSTEYVGASLSTIATNVSAGTAAVADTTLKTSDVLPAGASPGVAEIYAGTLTIPYYLSVPSASDPTAALTGYWHTNNGGDTTVVDPMPKKTMDITIPVLVTVPNASSGCGTKPGTGWPVVIFQHGITQDRSNVFAVADGLAGAPVCMATIAIDLPLHGITDKTNPFYDNQLFTGTPAAALMTGERTFDEDVLNNSTNAPGADGKIDTSGAAFINLQSLLTSRDNLREAVADLLALEKTIPTIKDPTDGTDLFDGSLIYYVGHSLGGIVGGTFLGVDQNVVAATLANPGGNITNLLLNSDEFAPIINAGLQSEGVVAGTQFYDDFFRDAQTVIDAGDPANYAVAASAIHPIHMIEVVG